ncbi:MAG: aconitase X swivel domain-containing protein [Thermodesulfobacteriota bacterium]
MEIRAHMVSGGKAEGEAVVCQGPFSFLGDLDPATGTVSVPRHDLEGHVLANKVFVFTTGKGSSGGDFAAWAAKKNGNAPAAMICLESEPVLSGAVIVTGIPMVDRPEQDIFELIHTGDYVKVDASAGIIEIAGE